MGKIAQKKITNNNSAQDRAWTALVMFVVLFFGSVSVWQYTENKKLADQLKSMQNNFVKLESVETNKGKISDIMEPGKISGVRSGGYEFICVKLKDGTF